VAQLLSFAHSLQYYVRSTKLILPSAFDALAKGSDPDRMKGALYILWSKGLGLPIHNFFHIPLLMRVQPYTLSLVRYPCEILWFCPHDLVLKTLKTPICSVGTFWHYSSANIKRRYCAGIVYYVS
jgi:hypothetical protein